MKSNWYKKEPLYKENTNCPICGKPLTEFGVQLVGVGEYMNIFLCSDEHKKEFIRQIWKLSQQKDTLK